MSTHLIRRGLRVILVTLLACQPLALARNVEVTVVVVDPDGTPIQHALVQIATSTSNSKMISARTDHEGVTAFMLDAPDTEPLRVRAFVVDAPDPETPARDFIGVMADRMAVRQFDPFGYLAVIGVANDTASLVAKASAAETRNGRLVGPDATEVSVVNLLTTLPQRASVWQTDTFSLSTPSDRSFVLMIQTGKDGGAGAVIHAIDELASGVSIPDITVEVPESAGRLSVAVDNMDKNTAFSLPLSAVSIDGKYTAALIVGPDGRLERGADGGADPDDPAQDMPIPPGNYYIISVDNSLGSPLLSSLSLLAAIQTDTAKLERDSLVRLTIHPEERTIVEWDATTICSTTDDLVRAVLFTPE